MSAPIVGGLGTLGGPLLGAFVLTVLGETMTTLTSTIHLDGLKQWCYGAVLLAIVVLRPGGIWPWIAERLGLARERRP
jgi:branched-chain amino acid transport system permease protein